MTKLLAAATVFFLVSVCSFGQHIPSYQITATINPKDATIDGSWKVDYTNNSSDTISWLWINIYPNAFKSDRTAFSEYLLDKGSTKFYFADQRNRGYINRLSFRTGDIVLKTEDHPLYIDVLKVYLDKPLPPKSAVTITTPFHVKVPYMFDRIGYSYPDYALRYWYPAIADYVKPLTDADSSSNTVADFDVTLKVPSYFIVNSPAEKTLIDSLREFKTVQLKSSAKNDIPLYIRTRQLVKVTRSYLDSTFIYMNAGIRQAVSKLASHKILPAVGYNKYDGLQLGVISQNIYSKKNFRYYIAPLYTFKSKSAAGIAGASYSWFPSKLAKQVDVGFASSTFSYNDGKDTTGKNVFARLVKVVPYARILLPTRNEKIEKSLTFRSYLLNERDLNFVRYSADSSFYPSEGTFATRYVNELSFNYSSRRVLYPYSASLQLQQGKNFYRVNATGNYFFNYPKGGGMNVRVFAARFGYIGSASASEKFATFIYQPKLTAVRGSDDYIYGNYFIGRSEADGFSSRQIMMRDGGLKIRTDLFSGLQGRSDNWIASVNMNTSIPKIFPGNIPLKIFFDAGTYAEAWDDENPNPRFMYVAGLQLSLFRNLLNVYAPVLYSKQIRDQLKTVADGSKFGKTISFSVDLSNVYRQFN